MRVKVSWQKYTVATLFFFVSIGLTGCAPTPKKYQDTSALEKPPELGVVSSTSEQAASEAKPDDKSPAPSETKPDNSPAQANKGLGDVVKRVDESHLLLILSFSEAWKQVAKAIELSVMEISDRNVQKGQYYVTFDLDNAERKIGEKPSFLDSIFNDDHYPKARYLLSFADTSEGTAVKVEFLELTETTNTDVQANSLPSDKGVSVVLQKLYSTLHDDLPLAQ